MSDNWIETGETVTYRCGHTKPHAVNKYWSRAKRAASAHDLNPNWACGACFDAKRKRSPEAAIEMARRTVGTFTDEELDRWMADPETFLRTEGIWTLGKPLSPAMRSVMSLWAEIVLDFQRQETPPAA